jgi:hypothetical protein
MTELSFTDLAHISFDFSSKIFTLAAHIWHEYFFIFSSNIFKCLSEMCVLAAARLQAEAYCCFYVQNLSAALVFESTGFCRLHSKQQCFSAAL